MKTLLALFSLVLLVTQAQAAFRAGASAVDITPTTFPRIIAGGFIEAQSSTITDKLFTRSLVLDDGKTQIALVIVDTCMMTRSLIDEAKALASKETGIPTDRMLVSATHTHAAPAAMGCLGTRLDVDYAKFLVPKIAEGIVAAHKRLQPAKIGWGVVNDWEHTHTRRWIRKPDKIIADPFGELTARANMHPGHESPDVTGPSGPSDPGLSVISVQTATGKPLAFFANYSMHYFGAKAISSDYYGAFARHIAKMLKQSSSEGPDFVAAMTQGTSGDQQWMDYSKPRPQITMEAYAEEVATKAMEAYAKIKHQKQAPIAMVEKLLTLNYRAPNEKRLAWARPIAAKIVNDVPKDKQEVYAREALILHERQKTEIKLQAIRIGDLAIATLPNEVYAITGLKLKAQSPLPTTINIELANGGEGYIPPPEQHALGGYTTWPARTAGLEVQAEPKMVETLLDALEEITGKNRQLITHTLGAYPQAVFASNPVSYWRMDEIAGDRLYPVNDWRGAEPQYEPGVARYLEGPQGEAFSGKDINRAPHFAGGRVDGFEMTGTDYSVEFWFWNALPTNARAVTGYLFSRGPDGDKDCPGDHLGIGGTHADAKPGCLFVYNGNKAKGLISGKTKLALKQWHHVVLNRTGKRLQLFLDGKPEIEADLELTHTPKDQWFIGGRSDNLFNFEGKIDEVAFYSDALTADETAAHYKASGMTPPAPPKLQTATPPLSPEESAKKWHVREGYRIDLVAAEPVVLDPVAFDWDHKGRLWVIEMADYPLGMDGNGKAGGRVVMLEDTNADGRYDKRTVIVNDLSYPTGILTWREGVLVTAAPDIFFIKPNGEKQVLYTGFSTGNQQLRVNGLRWGMDGWVYCAAGAHNSGYNKSTQIESKLTGKKIDLGSRDFRFKPDTGEFDPQSGPSQFGRARDDWGHWFGVQNSFPLWHYVLQDHYLRRNPHVIPPDPIHQLFPRNPPVYPVSSMEKRFHSFDQAGRFTSACGIEVYRDRLLFDDGKTHAFTCEPFHNVVQHHVLEDDGVTFKATRDPAESKMDFLASEDRWCRPVMVRTGPDGALWVADMYRYMIEHPQWLPQNGKDELLPHYREGDDKGRIWKVSRTSALSKHTNAPQGLASANGWQRDKAQMEMAWGGKKAELDDLLHSKQPQTRAQAAWASLNQSHLNTSACLKLLTDESPQVREQALQIAERLEWKDDDSFTLHQALMKLVADADAKVRLQLACSAGEWHDQKTGAVLVELLRRDGGDPIMLGAILSSASEHLLKISKDAPDGAFAPLASMAIHGWYETALANLCERLVVYNEFTTRVAPRLRLLHQLLLAAQSQGTTILKMRERTRTERLASYLDQIMSGQVNVAMSDPWDWKDDPLNDLIAMGEIPLMVPGREAEGYKMLTLWLANPRANLQQAAVNVLGRHPKPETDNLILEKLPTATPLLKQDMIAALLSHEDGALKLMTALKKGSLPSAGLMDAATRIRLLQHPSNSVKSLAKEVFQEAGSSKRADVLAKFQPSLKLKGDAAKGKTTFAQVCISCHKLDGVGIELGPDLRSVVQHDAEKLLNSILDPSAIIEPGFMAYHCTLKSGEQLYGVIATETSASLTLKMAGNMTKSVLRSEIEKLQSTGASLMPEGLEAALTPQSLADLIAYLQTPK